MLAADAAGFRRRKRDVKQAAAGSSIRAAFVKAAAAEAAPATSHPDFDDTPLEDENGDGDPANDGEPWHSHRVVLTPSETCGPGALSARDIPEGESPALPMTWPGLPLFIDSPGYAPVLDGATVAVTVTLPGAPTEIGSDGVTSALRVNANLHAPLLCVTDVFDVALGQPVPAGAGGLSGRGAGDQPRAASICPRMPAIAASSPTKIASPIRK